MASPARVSVAIVLALGCGAEEGPDLRHLSGWGLFDDLEAQRPAAGVEPYEVNAPLFSDYTKKRRFIRGTVATAFADAPWDFVPGTVLVKTFSMLEDLRDPDGPERLLETRLLIRTDAGWEAQTFVWNEDQSDATRVRVGGTVPIAWRDAEGGMQAIDYVVPNENQCANCHGEAAALGPLGPRTRQLDRVGADGIGQLRRFAERGLIDAAEAQGEPPLPDPFDASESLERRARAYLEGNCAHCHRRESPAESSGLWLEWTNDAPRQLGVCKRPFSAGAGTGGRPFDIVPGDPAASIMVFRMRSTDPELKMPEMPTQLADREGADLVAAWIASMPPDDCR